MAYEGFKVRRLACLCFIIICCFAFVEYQSWQLRLSIKILLPNMRLGQHQLRPCRPAQ